MKIYVLILALLIFQVALSHQDHQDCENCTFSYQTESHSESNLSGYSYGPLSGIEDYFELQKEVDHTIGIHQIQKNQKGQYIHPTNLKNLKRVLDNNKKWSQDKKTKDNLFFEKHKQSQKPTYLWIGCSDSRLPANQILGLDYGELFVLRNVANIVSPSDISSLAVLQYAIEVLQVTDIIVAGHYGCGGVKAALTKFNHGPLQAWLSKLRKIRLKHAAAFEHHLTKQQKEKLLVQINVKEQVFNVASTPFVQSAWKNGKDLRIHGLVFDLATGHLVNLNITMYSFEQIPEQLALFSMEEIEKNHKPIN